MVYRDRPLVCPRCGIELERRAAHDRWRCARCRGGSVTTVELVRGLLEITPELLREGRGAVVVTNERRPVATPLPCPACGEVMERVVMGHVEIDRCFRDEVLWFDDWEQDAATREHKGYWLRRLLGSLYPES